MRQINPVPSRRGIKRTISIITIANEYSRKVRDKKTTHTGEPAWVDTTRMESGKRYDVYRIRIRMEYYFAASSEARSACMRALSRAQNAAMTFRQIYPADLMRSIICSGSSALNSSNSS